MKLVLVFGLLALQCLPVMASERAISLDLQDGTKKDAPVMAPYMIALRKAIESNWHQPNSVCKSQATVFFTVSPTGLLLNPRVSHSSGNQSFDDCARETISSVSPFYAPPKINGGILFIHATFDGEKLTNVLSTRPYAPPQFANRSTYFNQQQPMNAGGSFNSQPEDARFRSNMREPQVFAPQMAKGAEEGEPNAQSESVAVSQSISDEAPERPRLSGSASAFQFVSFKQLSTYNSEELSAYLAQLHEWLKLPLEELLK